MLDALLRHAVADQDQGGGGAQVGPRPPDDPPIGSGLILTGSAGAGSYFPQMVADGARLDDVLGNGVWLIDRNALAEDRLAPFRAAIGEWLAEKIVEKLRVTKNVEKKRDFQETRKDIPCIASMDPVEAAGLIAENPAYGTVICRCEKVTEGEIIDAIRRPLGARSLDGIKRRTRAGMGRCQAGFCSTKVMEILARELGIPLEEVTKAGGDSRMLTGGER